MCQALSFRDNKQKEPSTIESGTIGFDIIKRVFQVHEPDAAGKGQLPRIVRRQVLRNIPGVE